MPNLELLTEMLDLFPHESPQREALAEAIADVERINRIERMLLTIRRRPNGGWDAWAEHGCSARTLRAAIDGVPE